jgi:catechol 2,3-dioxygenase-like lactoylglutathione lyase family enzyme
MRARRIETVIQWVRDPRASAEWYARLLGVEPTPVWFLVDDVADAHRELTARGFTFNEPPFDIPPGRLVTLTDPDGNVVGLIDNSKGGMPGGRG